MLPRYPVVEKYTFSTLKKSVRLLIAQKSPFIGKIKQHVQFEGKGSVIDRYDSTSSSMELFDVGVEFGPRKKTIDDHNDDDLAYYLNEIADQTAEGMTKGMFKQLDIELAKFGNSIDVKGRPLTEDLLLEVLETMDFSFDANGNWEPPSIFVGKEQYEKISEMKPGKDFNQKLKNLVNRKLDEHNIRSSNRVLAG